MQIVTQLVTQSACGLKRGRLGLLLRDSVAARRTLASRADVPELRDYQATNKIANGLAGSGNVHP